MPYSRRYNRRSTYRLGRGRRSSRIKRYLPHRMMSTLRIPRAGSRTYRSAYRWSSRTLNRRVTALERNTEKKWNETTWTMSPDVDWSTGQAILPPLDTGTGTGPVMADRIGDSVNLRNCRISFTMTRASDQDTSIVRLVLVRFPAIQAIPAASDVFDTPTFTTINVPAPLASFYKKGSDFPFQVLFDKKFAWDKDSVQSKYGIINVPINRTGLRLTYENGTATQPSKNRFYLFAVSQSATGNHPLCSFKCRINYTDS